MKKFILTGGLAVGKSSIIRILDDKGYIAYSELFRTVLNENRDILPRENPELFIKKWFDKKIDQYYKSSSNEICFFERGIVDPIAAFLLFRKNIPKFYMKQIKEYRYTDPIFLIEPIPSEYYKNSWPRDILSKEEAMSYHNVLKDVYFDLGYEICSVPFLEIEKRADFIIERVK